MKGGAREKQPPRGHDLVNGKKIVRQNEKLQKKKGCFILIKERSEGGPGMIFGGRMDSRTLRANSI